MRIPSALLLSATSDGETQLLSGQSDRRRAVQLVGRAFAGTETAEPELTFHWLVGPHLTAFGPLRSDLGAFIFSIVGAARLPGCSVLASRAANGDLAATALVRKLNRAPKEETLLDKLREMAHLLSTMVRGRLPAYYAAKEHKSLRKRADKGIDRRLEVLGRVMAEAHRKHANEPHIYLYLLATDPTHQFHGHGARLVRATNRIADAAGLPSYLEASGDRNRAIYEHLGFKVVGTYTLADKPPPGNPDEGWPPFERFYAMVRPPSVGVRVSP